MAGLSFDDIDSTGPQLHPGATGGLSFDDIGVGDRDASARPLTIRPNGGATAGWGAPAGDASAAVGQGLVNGVPVAGPYLLGGLNRAAAGVRSLQSGKPFADELKNVQDFGKATAEEHPDADTAGQVAGAGLSIAALPGEAIGLVGSLPLRIAAGAGFGGGVGAADSAVRGQDPIAGGAIGALTGGAGPAVGRAVGSGYRAISSMLPSQVPEALQGIGNIGRKLLASGVESETPQTIAAAQQRIGPSGMLGELTPGLMERTGGVAKSPGPGNATVRAAYDERNAASMTRHSDILDNAFGPRVDMATLTRDTRAARSAAADPLYAAWRSTPVPLTPDLEAILQRPSVRAALPGAARLAGDQGETIYDPAGGLTAQGWDYVKRATDDQARSYGYGTHGYRVANNISREITSAIDNHPDPNVAGVWQQARQAWSNPTAIMNAREMGQQVFDKAQRADELVYDVQGMSQPERQAFLQGARDQVGEIMGSTTRGDTTARNKLLAPNSQAKLQVLLGQDGAANLSAQLEQEAGHRAAAQYVAGGSATANNLGQRETVNPAPSGGLIGWYKNLHIDQPSTWLPVSPESMVQGARGNAYETARGQIAPVLTATGDRRNELAQALLQLRARNAAPAPDVSALVRALVASGQIVGQQTGADARK